MSVDAVQRQRFENVWLWDDYPDKDDSDTGVDLVAEERKTGRRIAIQCKFYSSGNVNLDDIKTFVTSCATDEFAAGILIITTDLAGRARRKLRKIRMIEVWYPEKFDASETINWDNLTSTYINYQDSTLKPHIEDHPSSSSPYSTSTRPYYSQPDYSPRIGPYSTYGSHDKEPSVFVSNLINIALVILCLIAPIAVSILFNLVDEAVENAVVGVPVAISMLLSLAERVLKIIVAIVIVLGIFAFYGMSQRR